MIELDYGSIGQFPGDTTFSIDESVAGPVVSEALKWINYPSRAFTDSESGMDPQEGFDCSGFVKFILDNSGVDVPKYVRYASNFFDKFGIFVHFGLHRKGDLIFFSEGIYPDHMGIVLNKNEYIHSPGIADSKVKISKFNLKPIKNSPSGSIYNSNPIGFKRIALPNGRFQKFS